MPNLGAFKHGVSWSDVPTSIISPIEAIPGINVVFGSAPLHLIPDGKSFINKPRVYNTYADAVAELGYSTDWDTYDICEHMDAQFVEFGMYPVIYVAVNDPEDGEVAYTAHDFTLANGQVDTLKELIIWKVVVKDSTGAVTYVEGEDYLISLSDNNTIVITRIASGDIPAEDSAIKVSGAEPGGAVTATEIIGGVTTEGVRTGLEVIEDVFQLTGFIPGVIICPKWSSDATVAAAMNAKSESINGCFRCDSLVDVDTSTVKTAQDVKTWKDSNNIVFPGQQCLFGKPTLIGVGTKKIFHFASQQGPLMQWVDTYKGEGLPYFSPSNKQLRMNALLLEDESELPMHLLDANMLNSQGVVTALNFIGGWRSWGNRTAAYPSTSDVKDVFIPVRRMFNYIGNTIILTIWQKVDEPGNRRLIDAIVNSLQLWLDGIANSSALLGARLVFRHDENPTTELLAGHYTFHVLFAVPTPAEWIDFKLEYYVPFTENLFSNEEITAAA